MADRQKVVEAIEYFYEEIIEKYKDLEKQVASESKLSSIFKKVDYKARIGKFKNLKKKAQNMNTKAIIIDKEDYLSGDLKDKLDRCITLFGNVIDAQVGMNLILNKKSEGKKMGIIEYKKAAENVQKSVMVMQGGLKELDAVYADLDEI